MQLFKESDAKEVKVRDCVLPLLQNLGVERDAFYNGAYTCFEFGDVLIALNASPLADTISAEAFRTGFFAIHELFTRPGTFEFYLEVFRAIFGDDVDVEFVVPAPGRLQINIESLTTLTADFLSRSIVDNVYERDEVVDHDGFNIAFQGTVGIKTQSEMDALMVELHPAGLFVETDLELID